ncbi:NAD(P)H-binding protein [Acetobacteraceae bacterium KSS12]|uniref:NAD(P)H-binding protein n=1 Tax=Rhizosaccharibacter radicis TaxID=2782605 RepID=A0ABT1W0W4_9PROT|nr:NAD(P)H-binding protein [Acetobacteraceae bacterium KSS12]
MAELASSGWPVVAGTRSPERIASRFPTSVEVRRVDFDDPQGLRAALRDIQHLLIVSTDELSIPGKRQAQHRAALDAAVAAGVSFVVYTSMPEPDRSPLIPFSKDHAEMERALQTRGIHYATLRNSWYQENLLGFLPRILADGHWFTAAGEGRLPYVARADAARAAAAALHGRESGVLDIAGPDLLSVDAIAKAVHDTLGLALQVHHVEPDRVAAELAHQGVPAPLIPMIAVTEAHQRAGGFEIAGNDVRRLTGRAPQPLADFLRTSADRLLSRTR